MKGFEIDATSYSIQYPPIVSFSGEFSFLSNFYPCIVYLDDAASAHEAYPSVEHAYQAAKTFNPFQRTTIRNASHPGHAKRLGNTVDLRKDWNKIKIEIMLDLLRQKFENAVLKQKLIATYPAKLIEGNTWGDTYWGVYKGVGTNMLGELLLQVRSEVRKGIK